MRPYTFRLGGVSLAAISMAMSAPLVAQDNAAEEDSILVTAEREQTLTQESPTGSRLGLTLLETPATVSVVTGDDLRARGDMSILDAATRAPGRSSATSSASTTPMSPASPSPPS